MAVRNFWLDAYIDGRETRLGGGPRSKTGEMRIELYQRNNGEIDTACTIQCKERNGKLRTKIFNHDGILVAEFETER